MSASRALLLGVLFLLLLMVFYRVILGSTSANGATSATGATTGSGSGGIQVSSAAALQKALSDPRGGYTIDLAPGNYGWVNLVANPQQPRFLNRVTIRSLDPCNPAVFQHLTIRGLSNITVQSLRFEDPNFFNRPRAQLFNAQGKLITLNLLRTDNASDIIIRDNLFTGPTIQMPGGGQPDEGYAYGFGWKGVGVRNATFIGNEATNLYKAVSVDSANGLVISGNSLHEYRSDAVYLGNVSNVTITQNRLSDPRPWFTAKGGAGDHADFIQIQAVATGLIESNYLDIGNVATLSQGIFSPTGSNLLVRNNVLATRGVNAIAFFKLVNSQIVNNLVVYAVPTPGLAAAGVRGGTFEPQLRIWSNYSNVRLSGNIASRYPFGFDNIVQEAGIGASNNIKVQSGFPTELNYYRYLADGRQAPLSTGAVIGNVSLPSLPPGVGPDPAAFGYLSLGKSRAPAACRRPGAAGAP